MQGEGVDSRACFCCVCVAHVSLSFSRATLCGGVVKQKNHNLCWLWGRLLMNSSMPLSQTVYPSSLPSVHTTTHARTLCRAGVGLHVPVVRLRIHAYLFRVRQFKRLLSLSTRKTLSKMLEPVKGIFKIFSRPYCLK
jgi:hypothetical protein